GSFAEAPAFLDEGPGQPVGAVVGLPAVHPFGAEAAMVDPVPRAAADSHNAPVLDADVQGTAVGAEHAARLHPPVRLLRDVLVHARRPPAFSLERGALTPNI